MTRRTAAIWTVVAIAVTAAAMVIGARVQRVRARSITIYGAVIRRDEDTRKELPIEGVLVTISNGTTSAETHSDASGAFTLVFPQIVWPGRTVDLSFRRAGYEPLDLKLQSGIRLTTRQLYVAALTPLPEPPPANPRAKLSVVSNIRVRYTTNFQNEINIGTEVRNFQVVNKRDVPCAHRPPCSPDGNWKASRETFSLDAGPGNEYREIRVSCIAGPCPFTHLDSSGYADGGRNITVSALDWSDTATFLLEAEVYHSAISSNVRELYPVIFGQALHFTLPPTQEGVSIEAELDGTSMVFPLGPDLFLSWATCTQRQSTDQEKSTIYRCELKPGYRF